MSDNIPTPPLIPPQPAPYSFSAPPGHEPSEREHIDGVLGAVDALLRQPRRLMYHLRQQGAGPLIVSLLIVALICSLIYGLVVGTFSLGDQLWAAPLKIAAGLFLSALICFPSLYIFSCLGGSQARLAEVFGLVAGLLTLLTVLLIGFAPVAWIFSRSTESVVVMGALHLAFWLIATYFGLRFLHAGFHNLDANSGGGLKVWIAIFLLVMLQMATALRPIVGEAEPAFLQSEKKFFVSHWMECVQMGSGSKPGTANARP